MKKFNDPMDNGFAPFYWDSGFLPVFGDIYSALESLLKGDSPAGWDSWTAAGNAIIVSGCEVTLNGGGPNIDISAGVVYFPDLNKFVITTAQTNVADPYYLRSQDVTQTETFKDSVVRDYIVDRSELWSAVSSGTDQARFSLGANGGTPRLARLLSLEDEWVTSTYNAGNFVESVTVTSAKIRYRRQGQLLIVQFKFQFSAISTQNLSFDVPASLTIQNTDDFPVIGATYNSTRATNYMTEIAADSGDNTKIKIDIIDNSASLQEYVVGEARVILNTKHLGE